METPTKLLSLLSNASETVRRHDFIHIFSHYDADGISAAGITAKALHREGKEFCVTLFPVLNDENMKIIENSSSKCIILTDLGASYLDRLDALNKDVIVLDHHRTPRDSEKICYINPHLFGAEGATECCGSSLAYLLAMELNSNNSDLVQIALAGIVGDKQHLRGMKGINAKILDDGMKNGHVKVTEGSLIPAGNLNRELYLSSEPYISGVSGNSKGVSSLLFSSGISNDRMFQDLNENEQRKLSSVIALKLLSKNVSTDTMNETLETRYQLLSWGMDAESFSKMLDACGRQDLGSIGIGMCLGDQRCRTEAEQLNDEYRNKVVDAAKELDERGLVQGRHIQYFDSSESGFTGVLCGIAMSFMGDRNKPTIGINSSEEMAKASARGTKALIDRGLNLSIAMGSAAEEVNGEGGGHNIASGASFPSASKEKFIASLDNIVGEQLTAK
jgi:Single-stranded DNA-specific exonuclease